METSVDEELHSTGELISPWQSLARYQPRRSLAERLFNYALYALWALAVVVAFGVLLFRR